MGILTPRLRHELPGCDTCQNLHKSIFCKIPEEDLKEISKERRIEVYKKKQIIFNEGNHPRGLYCIHQGKVKIYKHNDDGREQIVRLAGQSTILGYRSLLSNELYSASAMALEDTILCQIPKQEFLRVLQKNFPLTQRIMGMLTKDLRRSEQKVTDFTKKPVWERVAEALILLVESFGYKDDGMTIDVTLTRREIGGIAGIATETTIRTLSDLKRDGLIQLNGKRIVVENYAKLERLANIA